jgi:sulfite reductase (NADPH) flavoprotein alpha-component
MTISIWRYSHLALAVSSFLLLALASITGVILAFEPVSEKTQPFRIDNFGQVTLAQTLPLLRETYPGISELTVDANQFVLVKGSDNEGNNLLAYIDARSGNILGTPPPKNEFFQWVTNLHRSLFLKETGRFFVGLIAFLLALITISGTMLILQRQRGIKRFFNRIVKDSFAQYYHVVLGRLSLIPIFIIALSGTYLSLVRFELISSPKVSVEVDFDAIRTQPKQTPADFSIFKNTLLSEVETIEFPFSEDPEDYYTLKLTDREVSVNQVTGDVLSEVKYPTAHLLTTLSLDLHTGRTSFLWAIVLAVATCNILFFIYSGFAITWKRIKNRSKNKYTAAESRFIILVGSENGSTYQFAQALHKQLLKQGEKSFVTELNNYTIYPKAEHLVVMTATYGLGEAPSNALKFAQLLQKYPQAQQVHYAVVGFGSHAYPDYCKFAFDVNQLLSHQPWAAPLVDIHTVNDRSPGEFSLWAKAWSQQASISLTLTPQLLKAPPKHYTSLKVTSTTNSIDAGGTFLIRLQPRRTKSVTSGDLLAIYPANDHRERLYSIGMLNNELQLSVRLHEGGLGSGYLYSLLPGQQIEARIIRNEHFHFPKKATTVVMISNGTGIGPFLGMICQNRRQLPIHLYCGFRERQTFEMYRCFLEDQQLDKQLAKLHVAFSREGEKQYVSDLVARDAAFMAYVLDNNGTIMICGSLAMQKDVLDLLDTICQKQMGKSISYYQSRSQVLMDCY